MPVRDERNKKQIVRQRIETLHDRKKIADPRLRTTQDCFDPLGIKCYTLCVRARRSETWTLRRAITSAE